MVRAEATLSKLPDEEDLHPIIVSVFACKLKSLANSRGLYPLADMETSDNTLDQVHSRIDLP